MQCPNCGSVNRDGAKFCDECGLPLGGAIARAAAAEPLLKRVEPDENDEPIDEESEAIPHGESSTVSAENAEDEQELSEAVDNEQDGNDADGLESIGEAQVNDGLERDIERGATRPLDSPESELEDITKAINTPELPSDAAKEDEEDEFAGFTKHSEDGFSFSDPLSYDGTDLNALNAQGPGFTMKMPRMEGEPVEKNRDFMASSTVPKKSHAKTIAIVLGIVAVVAIIVAATFALGLWGGKAVPDVVSMTETDARAILEDSGFTVRATQVKSDDTEGLVLIMDPAAGTRAPDGSEVIIHVAAARIIPDVVGKPYEEALALLAEEGFDTIEQEKVKSAEEEGIVLTVNPETGSRAKSTAQIKLGVSEAYRVPDVSGMYWDDAFAAVKDAGLVAQVVYVNTEYYPEGTIIGTTPAAGTIVSEGDLISINIAQSRATLLTQLTQNMLVPGSTVTVNGYNFTIDALNSVNYVGNDTVAFSFTGRPFVSLLGEVIHASSQTVNGQVVWSPSNEVVSIS